MKFISFDNLADAKTWFAMNQFSLKSFAWSFGKYAITISFMEK